MARPGGKDRGLFERPKGSGVWWVRYHDHRGKERREKVGSKSSARQVYEMRKNLIREVKLGLKPETALTGEVSRVTLGTFITSCIPELKQKKSWKDQERFAKLWTRLIGDFHLEDVSPQHAVLRRTARLERGIAPATCNRETEFLKAILERAVRDGVIEKNPLKGLKLLPVDNTRYRTATGGEEQRLSEVMEPDDLDLVSFAIDTGIRRERVFSLPWAQVDLEGGWITVLHAKAGSSRQVPMTDRVLSILERRYSTRKGAWVFPNEKGKPLDPDTWCARKFRPALEAAGITGLWFHDLRRTFGSRMTQRGQGGRVLTGIMGHKSTKTTDRYAHLDPTSYKAAIQVLNDDQGKGGLRVVK